MLREFRTGNEYPYDRRSSVRWVLSHVMRYPHLAIGFIILAIFAISAFTYTSFQIQQAYEVIEQRGTLAALATAALGLLAIRALFAIVDMINTVIREFLASRLERDARESSTSVYWVKVRHFITANVWVI